MLQNAYLLAKIGADAAENERKFCQKNLQKLATTLPYPHCSGVPRALAGLRSGVAFRGCGVETFTMGMGHFEHCNLEKRGECKGTLRKGQACSAKKKKKHRKTSQGKSNFQDILSGKSCSIFCRHFGSSSRLKTLAFIISLCLPFLKIIR